MSFPNTPILDNSTRADESPLNTSNWPSAVVASTNNTLKVVSNQFASIGFSGTAAWNASLAANQEAFIDVAVAPTGSNYVEVFVRVQNPGASNSYYGLYINPAAGHLVIEKNVSGVNTDGVGTFTQAVSAGDGIGLSISGSTLTAYYRPGAGSWVSLGSVSDSSVAGSGQIGMAIGGSAVRATNFGGGNPAGPSTELLGAIPI